MWLKKNHWYLCIIALAVVFGAGFLAGNRKHDRDDSQIILSARSTITGLQKSLDESLERNRVITETVERNERERQAEVRRALETARNAEDGIRDASDGIDKAIEINRAIGAIAGTGRD